MCTVLCTCSCPILLLSSFRVSIKGWFGLYFRFLYSMYINFFGNRSLVVFEPFGPVITNSICKQVALAVELGSRNGVVAGREPLELLPHCLVPERKGPVAAGGGERIGVEGMEVDGVDWINFVGRSMALECETLGRIVCQPRHRHSAFNRAHGVARLVLETRHDPGLKSESRLHRLERCTVVLHLLQVVYYYMLFCACAHEKRVLDIHRVTSLRQRQCQGWRWRGAVPKSN